MERRKVTACLLVLLCASIASAGEKNTPVCTDPDDQAVEYGKIAWLRNYDDAVARARKEDKPLMILFDEVPGCGGCKRYGKGTLSNPVVIDAARSFVTLAIRNNAKGGHDVKILKKFKQPAWANPEVRFVDANGEDLVPRAKHDWTTPGLLKRMAAALEAQEKEVPGFLAVVNRELSADSTEKACFWMACYWAGERNLGAVDGVLATRIGWLKRREVIEVTFDPNVISFEQLGRIAGKSCGRSVGVYARSDQQAKVAKELKMPVKRTDDKVNTSKTRQKELMSSRYPRYKLLPMTEAQAARLNSRLCKRNRKVDDLLSPSQIALAERIEAATSYSNVFPKIWFDDYEPARQLDGFAASYAELEEILRKMEDGKKPGEDKDEPSDAEKAARAEKDKARKDTEDKLKRAMDKLGI